MAVRDGVYVRVARLGRNFYYPRTFDPVQIAENPKELSDVEINFGEDVRIKSTKGKFGRYVEQECEIILSWEVFREMIRKHGQEIGGKAILEIVNGPALVKQDEKTE